MLHEGSLKIADKAGSFIRVRQPARKDNLRCLRAAVKLSVQPILPASPNPLDKPESRKNPQTVSAATSPPPPPHSSPCPARAAPRRHVVVLLLLLLLLAPPLSYSRSGLVPSVLPLLQELADCLVLPPKFLSQLPRGLRLDPTRVEKRLLTLCMENSPWSEAAQGDQVAQGGGQRSMQTELGVPTASVSVAKMKLLQKRKSSSANAPKPPAGKRRKPSDSSWSRATKRRKLRSVVWKDFEPIYEGSLVVQAKCIHCLDVFAANRENGRSSCRRHLEACKQRIRMNQMVDNMRSDSLSNMSPDAMALKNRKFDQEVSRDAMINFDQMVDNMRSDSLSNMSPDAMALKNWKFDQEVSHDAMINFIVLQELPFSLVEHEPFRKFIATLNPWFTIGSRTTVAEDVVSSFENRKLALREIIKASDSRVSLTADFWTSKQNLGYLCITCHFINKEWKLQKRIISFNLVASPHDGLTMFNALLESLKDWHLDNKVFSITLDNAKNNNKMVSYLSQNLKERQLFKGNTDMIHMRCAACVLNLIVQDGFKMIESATTHIRESVKYIRSDQACKQRFEDIIVQLGISSKKRPSLDVPTRWNSTYLMILSAVEYKVAFEALDSQDHSYMDLPSPYEWKMADLLCQIFKPFYDAINVVSGSLYPTSHQCFHVLWKVKERIEKEALNEDQSITAMAVKMKEKFQTYWDLSYLQICVPVVLDPRFKFNFVAFRLDAGFGNKGPSYTAKVKSTVNDLFSAYSSQTLDSNSNCQPQSNAETVDEDNPWADWEQHLMEQRRSAVKNELEVYLQDGLFPREKKFDILQWWMMHSTKYPILSLMARDVLAAPATAVASESAFSTGGRKISKYRSRLTSKNVEALICLQDWLRAEGYTNFKMAEDIDDDEDQYYEGTA